MKKLFTLALTLLTAFSFAQQVSLDRFKNMKTRSIGPAGMSGRVTAIDAVVANPDIIYLGTASGGVWKTENSGITWQSIFDEQPILNIGAVAVQQSNPSIVWVGTGEGNPRNSLNIGAGIFKSLDAGKTWKMMGLEKTRNIHRIIIDPNNPDVIYAAAIGNPYAEHAERGVYKTTDGGDTWKLILHTNDTSGCADLIIDPTNPNKLLAAMWQHRRTPYSFKSGGKGSGLYVTYDAGKNWKKLGKEENLPEGNYGRIGLTIAPSDPKKIYAMIECNKNGLYKTDDGGFKWELVNSNPADVTNRPFYFQDIRVDSKNENRLYNIYQMISMSEDGGKTFKVIIPYSGIHPDHHAFWIHPSDPNFIIDGNDGGIGISRDRGKSWKFDEQLPLGQFYHINVDNELPYNVMGGLQDNGSWRGPAYTWIEGGIKNYYWSSLWDGDGFDVSPDPTDANWVYAMSQGGELGRYNIATGEATYLKPSSPDLKTRFRFNWNAGFAQSPFDVNTIYYGSQFVHMSTNKGNDWQIISPDLTTNDTAQQRQDENGGISLDITGAENYNTILCIEPSTKDKNVIWVGTDDGNVQLTIDGGKTWKNFRGKINDMPLGAWIPQIKASRYNAGEAFVVCNDYRRGNFTPYIFRTKNFGQTWEPMLNEQKVKGYALCMIQDPVEPNLIFVGTEQGLWVSFDNGTSFQQWKNDYPSVSTYDLAIQEREADLCIGTFGRAIYILDDIKPLRKAAATNGMIADKKLMMYEPSVSYLSKYKNPAGYHYSSWGMFDGKNRPQGAAYSFYVNVKKGVTIKGKSYIEKKDSSLTKKDVSDKWEITRLEEDTTTNKKKKLDSAFVKIYTNNNELIRTLKVKADTGFNRHYWNFDMKAERKPGSAKPKKDAIEQGDMKVFPGTYKLVVELGKEKDSAMLTVKPYPTAPQNKEIYEAQMNALKRLSKTNNTLVAATDRLTEADETIAKITATLKDIETPEADSIRKVGKAMTDSIKNLRNLIMGKPLEKQGYGRPYQLTANRKLNEATENILGKIKIPGKEEIATIEMAETLTAEAIKKVNTFFNTKWKDYQKQVDAAQVKLFKEWGEIE